MYVVSVYACVCVCMYVCAFCMHVYVCISQIKQSETSRESNMWHKHKEMLVDVPALRQQVFEFGNDNS